MRVIPPSLTLCALVLLVGCAAADEPDTSSAAPDAAGQSPEASTWPLPETCAGLVEAAPALDGAVTDMELSEEWFNDPAEFEMPADAEAAAGQAHDRFPGLHCGWMGATGGYMLDVYPHDPVFSELRLAGSAQTEVAGLGEEAVYRADAGSLTSRTEEILVFSTALGEQATQEDQVAVHEEVIAQAD
ncbi:hypothetical protein [Nocardiopsis ansamitocini]|uniref:DUF3558 domain-containing protein n=1 Tax=Nocardiopsis ansamitocini TaxID=1670832 RepID=A0A9W6P7E3_9ACTN|nr:hypothetical protein [Nocardiopsis ansamitocini]GLU48854.1 hypothetical protein Nans01_32050 [Nocardiopsis ansamitocini]